MLSEAQSKGQIVQLTLFDGWSLRPGPYRDTPWDPDNNRNITDAYLPNASDNDTVTQAFPKFYRVWSGSTLNPLGKAQQNYVNKILSVTRNYNNVFYEIMNEASAGKKVDGVWEASAIEMKNWHNLIRAWIANKHPGAVIAANLYYPLTSSPNGDFTDYEAKVLHLSGINFTLLHWKTWKDGLCSAV